MDRCGSKHDGVNSLVESEGKGVLMCGLQEVSIDEDMDMVGPPFVMEGIFHHDMLSDYCAVFGGDDLNYRFFPGRSAKNKNGRSHDDATQPPVHFSPLMMVNPKKETFVSPSFCGSLAFDITPEGGTHKRKGSVQRLIRLSKKLEQNFLRLIS